MKILLISFSLLLTFITDVTSQGVCTSPDLTVKFINTIFGKKDGGFSMKCEYGFPGSYSLFLWSIERDIGGTPDIVYTYFTGTNPPTSQPGANYGDRQIKFENNNTIVFGSVYLNDSGTYRCTVQFNAGAADCTESTILNVNAKPDFSYQRNCLQRHTEETLTVTGTDFYTSAQTSPNFIMEINGENDTLQTTIANQSDGFQMFTANITKSFNLKIVKTRLFMLVGDSGSAVDSPDIETEPISTPFLVIAVIMVLWEGIVIIVFAVMDDTRKVIFWILVISSPFVIALGVIFVIVLPVEACKPLEGEGLAAVICSAVAIPLGIAGLVLPIIWKCKK